MTDPIADMLTRIRNATLVHQREVRIPHAKLKEHIARILLAEGWLERVDVTGEPVGFKTLVLGLKYEADGTSTIRTLERVSRPSRRQYVKRGDLPRVLSGFGIAILSTSAGLMTDREARKRHLGGEILCTVS